MNIKNHISFHIGSDDKFPLEHRFFNLIAFYGGIICILGTGVNLLIDSKVFVIIATALALLVCWGAFYLSRFRNSFMLGKTIMTVFLAFLLGYIFFVNNGSRGPLLYLYMVYYLLLLIVWTGRSRNVLIALFTFNILIFLIVELKFPQSTQPYIDEQTRLLDVYLSYMMYVLILGAIMMFTIRGYVMERQKAVQSDHLKSAFLANMSHEIRTPMNAILGFTQLLENDLVPEKKEAYLKVIKDNGQSLLRLIEDIIDVSKIEAGELDIHSGETQLDRIFDELNSTFGQILKEYPEKKIDIIKESETDGLVVITDGTRLKQVLTNLMHNAIKFTDCGKIILGFRQEDEFLKFYVRDSGEGIKPEYLEEIFDRFRKIETDRLKKIQPGTGIGLSISKNLTELLGGKMSVSSEYGKGSEFYFTIPHIPVRIEKPVIAKAKEQVYNDSIDLSGKTILVAEDENANFFLLKKVLDRTNANVIRARNGQEAVDLFDANPEVDFILMDILMPVLNGYQATGIIKEKNPDIPIIAQTALAMEGDSNKVLNSGCDDYISKPIRMKALIEIIAKYLVAERIA
jgi:signal transduction histidine kinase/CheY-like chemotaxis protein